MAYYTDKSDSTSAINGSQIMDFLCSIAVLISLVKISNNFSANNAEIKKIKTKSKSPIFDYRWGFFNQEG
jgi:hypothetical protein